MWNNVSNKRIKTSKNITISVVSKLIVEFYRNSICPFYGILNKDRFINAKVVFGENLRGLPIASPLK